MEDVDLFEINEAFANVAMIAMRDLLLPHEKMNVNGGACALGHPIGASGARIVATLVNALKRRGLKRGSGLALHRRRRGNGGSSGGNMRLLLEIVGFFWMAACPCLADGTFPWKAGDTPPMLAGLSLGDTEDHVRVVLGPPDNTGKMGDGNVLEYELKGLQVIATKADGISIIRLRKPEAGAIDGIKIGDDVTSVITKWGHPESGQDRVALFTAGTWTVEVRLEDNGPKVVDILLAWNDTKWGGVKPGDNVQVYRPQ